MEAAGIMIDDVWSRTAPKYRNRSVVLLLCNMALFGALCCFMFWLRTGWYFPPTHDSYDQQFKLAVRFTGEGQVTAYDLLTRPISLKQVPLHAVVIGLLIATLTSIPILVSILYRLPAALPFCAMVGFLAVMPWMSVNLVLASAIAHYARRHLKFRFAAALLGFIPIGVYLLVSSRKYHVPADLLTTPFEQGLVVAPLLLSVVAACVVMAGVLAIARIVNYRPGAITPLLAVMFIAPWVLFMVSVGRDELHYRILESTYGPDAPAAFSPTDANEFVRRVARAEWSVHAEPKPTIEELETRVRLAWDGELEPLDMIDAGKLIGQAWKKQLKSFRARFQYRVMMACDTFRTNFPDSRYVPCVLFMKGRAQDMRVERELFRRRGQLRFYDGYPANTSRNTWRTLHENFPASPLSQVARYRLARLDAREGHIDEAIRWLDAVDASVASAAGHADPHSSLAVEQLFAKKRAEDAFYEEYADIEAQAAEFRSLLTHNRDALTGDAPLVLYLRCDPRHSAYHQNLREILELFKERPDIRIRDNIELQLALSASSAPARFQELERLRGRWPDGDTRPRVLYELGVLYAARGDLNRADAHFRRLQDEYSETHYAALARQKLLSGRASTRVQGPGT